MTDSPQSGLIDAAPTQSALRCAGLTGGAGALAETMLRLRAAESCSRPAGSRGTLVDTLPVAETR